METVAGARARLLAGLVPLGVEDVPLGAAAGRVLAVEIVVGRPLPGFDNSAMDGYAVRAADVAAATAEKAAELLVTGESRAGGPPPGVLEPGCAIAVMTGAPIPEGTDAVVRVEDTDGGREVVLVHVAVAPGTSLRRAGEDMRPGEVALPAGRRLSGADIAVCAALGLPRLRVHRRPRVAVLSTGDELVAAGVEPGPGQVVDSNAAALAVAIREAGGEVVDIGIAHDDLADLRARLRAAAASDLVVSSAGVSVGDHDHVRAVVEELGSLDLWRVAMRPGKPLAVGRIGTTPFLGLPGNPVSSQVTFELFGRPAVLALQGDTTPMRRRSAARALEALEGASGLETYVRVVMVEGEDGVPGVRPTGPQGSGMLRSMALADALAVLPADRPSVAAGELVAILPLR